jgi:tRNA (guanine37-N1)-methyltransferase
MLDIPRVKAVVIEGEGEGKAAAASDARRLVLLREGTERASLPTAALFGSSDANDAANAPATKTLSPPAEWVPSYPVTLDYSHATLEQVLRACLPQDEVDEVPSAFECVGGIAHLNLRSGCLPYRLLIGEALLDKNPTVDLVVNKVGTIESEYRVFKMEVIAERDGRGGEGGGRRRGKNNKDGGGGAAAASGAEPPADEPTQKKQLPYIPDSLETIVTQCGVRFSLDFAAVYWNSRLETEHARLVQRYFLPGQKVADAMCGVGPFAVPAALLPNGGAKVLANDLNPAAARYTLKNAQSNRVAERVSVFNVDGRLFIRAALGGKGELPEGQVAGEGGWPAATAAAEKRGPWPPLPEEVGTRPPVDHLVLNLPASAVEFLDALSGACDPSPGGAWRRRRRASGGSDDDYSEETEGAALPLPLVHVYTFQKDETEGGVLRRVERAMGRRLDGSALPAADGGDGDDDESTLARGSAAGVAVHRVRDVAPNKLMLCVTFRVPPECAFSGRLPSAEEGDGEAAAARICQEFREAGKREGARADKARVALKEQLEAEERARLAARTPKGTGAGGSGGGASKKARTAAS